MGKNFMSYGDAETVLTSYSNDIKSRAKQVSTMPTASASLAGKIYQYTGATTTNYTHGYFYECVNDGGTYKWQNVPLGGSGNVPAGGTAGQVLKKSSGTDYDTEWADEEGGGHTILNSAGTSMTQRSKLQFDGFDVEDNATNGVTIVHASKPIEFAFHYSENNSSPASVTYPAGYDNSAFTDPFYVDLSTGVPHYGDWNPVDKLTRWLFPKSCMLNYDGTVAYYLNENDETKREDGTASDVANASFGGNAMMEWAQDGSTIYWKIIPDSDGKGFTFVIANGQDKNDPDLKPWNHYNSRGGLSTHFYTPKYFGSYSNSRLRSISGQTNMVSQTRATEISRARANNPTSDVIWDTEVYADWLLLQMLCVLISKSTNTQTKFGYGRCSTSNTSAIGQGTMNGKGLFYGRSDQTSGVKVFGMENPWGNIWRAIRGLIGDNGTVKLKLTHGTEDGSTASDYNTDGSGYITHGTISAISGADTGYTSAMNISNKGITPKTLSGSDSTYYCDGIWLNNSQNSYGLSGGDCSSGLLEGAFCCNLYGKSSGIYATVGAALSCKPLI